MFYAEKKNNLTKIIKTYKNIILNIYNRFYYLAKKKNIKI